MKKTNLDRLLQRYISGEVTGQEKIKIEAWLDVKKTDEGTDMVLDEQDEERLFKKITSNIDNVEEIKGFRPAQGRGRTLFSNPWFQVAATVLLLVAGSYAIWFIASNPRTHETIAVQDIQKVILGDGTIVWLRKESKLTYDEKDPGIRNASLVGQALFEVAKDPSRPFTIACGEVTVKVVGTSFSLESGKEGVQVKVLTGKVNLSSEADRSGIDIGPNENVVYNEKGVVAKESFAASEVPALTANTEYNMEFKNTTMESVITRIENKFDVEIMVENKNMTRCRITADFTDHSLESTLNMISELLEIEFSIRKSTVTITGNGCN